MEMNALTSNVNALLRLAMNYGLSGVLPLYVVTEYPKSGGSWFSQMLSDSLQIPFPRNRLPRLESCVMQGHYKYSPFLKNVFCILRDGRDIMVSYYYYSLFENELYNSRIVKYTRAELHFDDYVDIRSNLPRFIEYKFTRGGHLRFTWGEFVNSWLDKDVVFVRYEDLLKDAAKELYRSILTVTGDKPDKRRLEEIVERYSFKTLTGRDPGQESKSSFLRKGIAGDWRHCFSREAKEVFNYFAGETLITLGYEKDGSWVDV